MQFDIVPRQRRRVGLTPLVDVVFNLLLFFMLASSLVNWRGLELATGSEVANADAPSAAEISVADNGAIRYQGRDWTLQPLAKKLKQEIQESTVSSVILRADPGVQLGSVVSIFDQLSAEGIAALALGESGTTSGTSGE